MTDGRTHRQTDTYNFDEQLTTSDFLLEQLLTFLTKLGIIFSGNTAHDSLVDGDTKQHYETWVHK